MSISAISLVEFQNLFKACVPATGWPRTIAVANSGGPDSSCLLFLISRLVAQRAESPILPHEVVSLTVDHGLQDASGEMADRAAKTAQSLGVHHIRACIPWGEPPFPAKPSASTPSEGLARLARYHVKFDSMTSCGASVLALGHHADDQVETSLIRIAKGTTESGAGGMRRCRRWGMGVGEEGSLGWIGYEGLRRWMIRPLLSVSKDRLLATCEAHNLEYTTDKTNFQPELTLRNAIRHLLRNPNPSSDDFEGLVKSVPPHIVEGLNNMKDRSQSLEYVSMDISDGSELLRASVAVLNRQVEDADHQVDIHLKRSRLRSPMGTFMLASPSIKTITDESARMRMVLRIMRYASFHPWGSIRADANRRSASLRRIIAEVWNPEPWRCKPFVAGSGVLWIPAHYCADEVRLFNVHAPPRPIRPGDICGWIAARQPPLHRDKMKEMGIKNPLRVDVTHRLVSALRAYDTNDGQDALDVLYDCRFLVTFNLDKMPQHLRNSLLRNSNVKVRIEPHLRWYWPKVVLHELENQVTILSSTATDDMVPWRSAAPWDREGVNSDWISMRWIRPLDAL